MNWPADVLNLQNMLYVDEVPVNFVVTLGRLNLHDVTRGIFDRLPGRMAHFTAESDQRKFWAETPRLSPAIMLIVFCTEPPISVGPARSPAEFDTAERKLNSEGNRRPGVGPRILRTVQNDAVSSYRRVVVYRRDDWGGGLHRVPISRWPVRWTSLIGRIGIGSAMAQAVWIMKNRKVVDGDTDNSS